MIQPPTIYIRQKASVRHLAPATILAIVAVLTGRIELLGPQGGEGASPGPVATRLIFSGVWLAGCAGYLLLPLLITCYPIRAKGRLGKLGYEFYTRYWFPFSASLFFGRALLLSAMEGIFCVFILNAVVQLTFEGFQAMGLALPVPFAVVHTALEWKRLKQQGSPQGQA